MVYWGVVLSLAMNFVAAAWVVVQGTEAVASYTGYFFESYYFRYAGATDIGDQVGQYEVISFILWAVFSLLITLASLYFNYTVWGELDARVADAAKYNGIVADPLTSAKIFTLLMINGLMSLIGGFALGDVSYELLTWWDSYGQTQKAWYEGWDKETYKYDTDGTAIEFDFQYHYIVLGASYILFSEIVAGGFWFLWNFKGFKPAVNCNLKDPMSNADKDKMLGLFTQALTNIDNCYTYLPQMLKVLDVNKNGFIDRCEDSYLWLLTGVPEADALKNGNILPVSAVNYRCNQIFNPLY
jgi:hypothetical protein